ncbi:hypothetical protein G0Q06_10585 [Puniceicoccales bacterium CK1056]|uniref:Uncharacterized protein n=2 Tax=Oceanipulchritudo coccoides TaxID=2706888 RepID=A0A6B2M1T8_9BACT|nr:hypothetical protein [Oceanipulchritudo coccoides]
MLWAFIASSLFSYDLEQIIGPIGGGPAPSSLFPLFMTVSIFMTWFGVFALAIWTFFPGNWLERIIRWLNHGGNEIHLTKIVLDEIQEETALPILEESSSVAEIPEVEGHPDQRYMPPGSRS